jgi:chromosome segregation ATPase
MTSGRKAYADLNRQVEDLRGEVATLSRQLTEITRSAEQVRAEENREVARLAQFRLGELAARRVDESLGAAEREAIALMNDKYAAQSRVETDIAASVARQRDLEAQRVALVAERDALLASFEHEHLAVAERTRATDAWKQLDERADRLAGQAALAREKADNAEGDRKTKGQPYEADKLFVYLWRRQYGSATYRAGALTRTLDGWVAGLIGYLDASRNYRLLIALPEHLRRHADSLEQQAAAARAELEGFERQALADAGVVALETELDEAETRIDELAAKIAAEEKSHAALLQRRGELADGTDEFTRKALTALTRAINEASAGSLRRAAGQTESGHDDRVVAGIEHARQNRERLTGEIAQLKQQHDERISALARVEELRRRFRNERYDGGDSEIDDDLDWDDVLGGVLRGVLEMTRAWERVQRHQRFRIPRGMRLPTGMPDIFGGGRGRGGGFGGGIFKGGGGFGGGGFKSGGGF